MATGITVIKSFMRKGFRLIGDGCYAAVFESNCDPNLVYKVGNNASDPYLAYIQANINSPHFPRVHSVFIDYDNNYYIVTMERLEEIPDHKRTSVPSNIRTQFTRESAVDPDMQSLVERVEALLSSCTDFKLDLHSGNIMMRGVVPVVTDPLAHDEIPEESDLSCWMDTYGQSLRASVSA
jgi:hypothetical protein